MPILLNSSSTYYFYPTLSFTFYQLQLGFELYFLVTSINGFYSSKWRCNQWRNQKFKDEFLRALEILQEFVAQLVPSICRCRHYVSEICLHFVCHPSSFAFFQSPAAAPKMSQAKITNFFSKPKTNGGVVTTTTTTSNGNNSISSSSVVDKVSKRLAKEASVDDAAEAEENNSSTTPETRKRKINEFFSKPKPNKKLNSIDASREEEEDLQERTLPPNQPPPPKHNLDLWTSTYRPKTSDQLVGNATARGHFFEWLSNWQENFVDDGHLAGEILTGKCAFICGPSGTGKTSLVRAIAADLHHSVLEFSCSSRRVSPAFLAKEVGESVKSHCINITSNAAKKFGKSLILLDDFDGLLFEPESSSLAEVCRQLRQLITTSQKPIVITAAYQPSSFFCSSSSSAESSELTSYFRLFQLGGIQRTVLRKHLEAITAKESAATAAVLLPPNSALLLLRCGDARRLINECQFWCSGVSSEKVPIFSPASSPRKPSTSNARQLIQQLDLLSLEDVYQTTLNRRLSAESTADYYNCHLFDRRHSLLTPELNSREDEIEKVQKELTGVAGCCEVISKSICSLLAGHYLPLTPRDPDYFALLFDLIALRPGLLAELEKLFLHSGQQMRRSSRIKRRQQKLSFKYLWWWSIPSPPLPQFRTVPLFDKLNKQIFN